MAQLLFIYGTLLNADNPIAHLLKNKLKNLGEGKIRGDLYDLDDYPGFVPNDADRWVYGSVCEIDDETLTIIDEYEGYGPTEDQPNLYLRQVSSIETKDELIEAWVYIYNRPVDELQAIACGDYREYLRQKKSP